MAAPVKPKHKRVTVFRGSFYLSEEQNARLEAEMRRAGLATKAHVIRNLIQRHLPPSTVVKVNVTEEAPS